MHPPKQLDPNWQLVLREEWDKPYLEKLKEFLQNERRMFTIYPESQNVFTALNKVSFNDVEVVILGQDPYHGPGQAHGLSFSVLPGVALPPSLKNIFLEIRNDIGYGTFTNGWLNSWAEQGVLLLNSVLTVRKGAPGSHNNRGWEEFTDAVIRALLEREDPIIFVLWGKYAKDKYDRVLKNNSRHHILSAAHPSPFSAYRGFFGCCHFSKINNILKKQNKKQINWEVL